MPDLTFKTAISGEGQNGLEIRGVPLTKLIDQADFVSTLFLSLAGRQPLPNETKLLNAVLVASIDHGLSPASGFVPRVVASSGNGLLTAMASGLLALGPYHGGAVTDAMHLLAEITTDVADIEKKAHELVTHYRSQHRRLPGYGHRKYTDFDPRTRQLFSLARREKIADTYMNAAEIVESALERDTKRRLVLNIDGALAALLLSLGLDPAAGNALFGLARVAGSIAHIIEEQHSGEWVRRIPDADITYTP